VTAVNGTADCELGRDSSWGPNVANCSNIGVEGIHIGDVMNCLNTRIAGSKFEFFLVGGGGEEGV